MIRWFDVGLSRNQTSGLGNIYLAEKIITHFNYSIEWIDSDVENNWQKTISSMSQNT